MTADNIVQSLRGKRVVVTGAAGVLGRWIATSFAERGAELFLTDKDESLIPFAEDLSTEGSVTCHISDFSTESAVSDLMTLLKERWSAPDILINNAGIAPFCPLIDTTDSVLDATLNINLVVPFQLTRECMKLMITSGVRGSLINVVSGLAFTVNPGSVAYSVSKAGLQMLTRGAALEGAAYGIRVNSISPGFVPSTGASSDDPNYIETVRRAIPLGEFAGPEDLVALVMFLSSSEASLITGAFVPVDGGRLAGPTHLPSFNQEMTPYGE